MKIAICLPTLKLMHTRCCITLLGIGAALAKDGHQMRVFFEGNNRQDMARSNLARLALQWNADYIFWLDSDIGFSPAKFMDFFRTAVKDGVDFATGIYPIRYFPFMPSVFLHDGTARIEMVTYPSTPFDIHRCGFGMVLMKNSMMERIYTLDTGLPFRFNSFEATNEGEDFYFCKRALELGYKLRCYPNFLADYHDEVTPWHMRKFQEERKESVAELAEYTKMTPADAHYKCTCAANLLRDEWNAKFGARIPTEAEVDEFYSNNENYLFDLTMYWMSIGEGRLNVIADICNSNPKSVLDFGCGIGDYSFAVNCVLPDIEVHAYDLNKKALDYMMWRRMKRGLASNGNIVIFNKDEFKWLENHYDVILAHDVLEHLTDPDAYLVKFHKMLKPGGILVANVSSKGASHPMHISDEVGFEKCGFRMKTQGVFEVVK